MTTRLIGFACFFDLSIQWETSFFILSEYLFCCIACVAECFKRLKNYRYWLTFVRLQWRNCIIEVFSKRLVWKLLRTTEHYVQARWMYGFETGNTILRECCGDKILPWLRKLITTFKNSIQCLRCTVAQTMSYTLHFQSKDIYNTIPSTIIHIQVFIFTCLLFQD